MRSRGRRGRADRRRGGTQLYPWQQRRERSLYTNSGGETVTFRFREIPVAGVALVRGSTRPTRLGAHRFRQTAARISFGGVSRESPTHVFPARRPTRSHRRRRASRASLARARILVRIPRELLAKQARRRASRPGGPRARLVARPSAVHAASVLGRGDGVPRAGAETLAGVPVPAGDATTTLLVFTSPEHRGGAQLRRLATAPRSRRGRAAAGWTCTSRAPWRTSTTPFYRMRTRTTRWPRAVVVRATRRPWA